MSIPLAEIKEDLVDPKRLYSTLIERRQILFSFFNYIFLSVALTHRHPKVLSDLLSGTLWWVSVVLLTGSPRA